MQKQPIRALLHVFRGRTSKQPKLR
uniref:Uncharacterized protein n=1 Tax=Anguilla anguilla TaxID=7936 RepID=A0A0E9U5S0_ANGAN